MTRRHLLAVAAALLGCPAVAAELPIRYADIARTGDLICELTASSTRARPSRRSPDLLMIFESLGAGNGVGRVFSNRRIGPREVRMYSSETGLHLVEDLSGSVVVTSLTSCDAREGSGTRCVRYSAVNAWHFDQTVHRDPDMAFRRLPGTSYAGHCEAWHMQERRKAER